MSFLFTSSRPKLVPHSLKENYVERIVLMMDKETQQQKYKGTEANDSTKKKDRNRFDTKFVWCQKENLNAQSKL